MLSTELNCFVSSGNSIPIYTHTKQEFAKNNLSVDESTKTWLLENHFKGDVGQVCLIPTKEGKIGSVHFGIGNTNDPYNYATIFSKLPEHTYHFDDFDIQGQFMWALAAYKKSSSQPKLKINSLQDEDVHMLRNIYWVRDLINTPSNQLGPAELAKQASSLGDLGAKVKIIDGNTLENDYPAIFAVGKASERKPCLIDIRWGDSSNPSLTLVGKGVCFDSGGLNLKPAQAIRDMKKDMGGAANVLALARMIIQTDLPINLRVLIPAVENSISGCAYRPGDVITTKSGLKIEIDNTDAEGRVVLSDALYEASSERIDLLIDMATLTGAASYGLAPDLPSMFCDNLKLARELVDLSYEINDPVWHMPYYKNYEKTIRSDYADLLNCTSKEPYGGAIKAGLFLQKFIQDKVKDYIHFDMMCWNSSSTPGRPYGGEALAIRTLFKYLKKWSK